MELAARREGVQWAQRNRARFASDKRLRGLLRQLAHERSRFGYRSQWGLLQR